MPTIQEVLPTNPQYPQNQVINVATGNAANIPPEVSDFFGNYMGIVAKKRCVLHYLATHTTLPLKSGTSFLIPTFHPLPDEKIPLLKEGQTPVGENLKRTQIKITPQQIGNYVTLSDVAVLTVQDATLRHAAHCLGTNLAIACDKMIAKALDTEVTETQYASGGVGQPAANQVGYITQKDIMTATTFLKMNNALMVSPYLFGSTVYGSTPVNEAFYCFCHTAVEPDLYNIPAFQSLARYGSSQSAHWLGGEIGECLNLRFVSSNNLPVDTASAGATADKPYLKNFVLGRHAYYTTTLGLKSAEFIYGSTGFDPLRQRVTVGYKAWFACAVNTTFKWSIKLVSKTSTTL